MANKIQIKRRAASGAPTTSQAVQSELAYNEADNILYIGSGGNASASSSVVPIAGSGAFVDLTSNQTISGTKTFNTALGISSGGTNSTATPTAGGVGYGTGTAHAYTIVGTSGQVLVSGGSGTPTWTTNISGSAAGLTSTLVASSGGTGFSTYTVGDVLAAGTTSTFSKVSPGAAGTLLTSNGTGTLPSFTALTTVALTTGTISTTPTGSTDIVNKSYADSIGSGINFHAACQWATTADLGSVTYSNGSSGVGATLTNAGTQATLVIDGHTFTGTDVSNATRVLVKNESNQAYNGIYTVTNQGSGSTNWVLTRATDYDTSGTGTNEVDQGDYVLVINGTANANTSWIQQTPLPITIGTTAIVFLQFGAGGTTYTAGTGLTLSSNQFSITNTTVTANSYGDTSLGQSFAAFTVNGQGQLTAASTVVINVDGGTY
jgi:hypothetical protein